MAVPVELRQGTRAFAGIRRPFFISQEMLRGVLEKEGITHVLFFDRKTPAPVDPHLDPRYTDGWDEWVVADYLGPTKTLMVEPHWDWLVLTPLSPASPALPPSSQSRPSTAIVGLPPAVVLGLGALELYVYYRLAKGAARKLRGADTATSRKLPAARHTRNARALPSRRRPR